MSWKIAIVTMKCYNLVNCVNCLPSISEYVQVNNFESKMEFVGLGISSVFSNGRDSVRVLWIIAKDVLI